jgi:hypothetical protein
MPHRGGERWLFAEKQSDTAKTENSNAKRIYSAGAFLLPDKR